MIRSKYAVFFLALLAVSCSRSSEDYAEEDYNKLFPFGGIEKPKVSYEDQVIQLGDPYASVSDFVYPGVEITQNVRTYKVTLTCSFKEQSFAGESGTTDKVDSRYVIRYIDADKKLRTIGTDQRAQGTDFLLTKNKEHIVTFKARSGFPMFLWVNGVGPQNSSVHATISAVSEDGFTIVKPLAVHEYQNQEGIDKIKAPFCAYIILP
ncbi:hypothetical protein J5A56_04285 [Prevotella melaninogenica]|uniref:hypothetical protein n=1 Tax=Prevotella TaxID=838 RepID=UPI0003AD49E5|nr:MULTISPECIES: hypothetical protein [Prevotella]ERJ76854.1 hypothetical protein HMPREF9148_01562 [Prevotella sp. F0091]QUB72536.1 hypothetical protein J5A56_04285 [Prevotella melaninogenica]